MRKKYTELFTIILSVIIVVVVILSVVYFIFFTSDDFLDAIIYKSIAAITKFVVLPSVTLLMIFYFLGITKRFLLRKVNRFGVG